jgi:hypothetical protein
MMTDKVIVTNMTALKQKYAAAGVKAIQKAVTQLIAADKKRGLETILVALDDATAMKKLKAPPVKKPLDAKQNKQAVDGVYKALAPDYIMILGAIDVIPHQDLKNPLFTPNPNGDTDEFAYGDLPYACDQPYSKNLQDFTGPTRVVGRLPDLTGETGDPDYLLGVLQTATNWKSSPRSAYQNYLGISTEKWRGSTALSLTNIFNSDKDLQTSPKKSPKWKANLINRRVHFINCHGGDTYPNFVGQSKTDDSDTPISLEAEYIAEAGNIVEGTVAAAECCYGGQLYDRSAAEGQMGICNAYLGQKAYGVFASTTTSYGPFTGNDQADLICQYFLQRILSGDSMGRAALEARQRFIEKASPLSPMNQKTLAQFNLYGDPSIIPVASTTTKLAVGPKMTNLAAGAKSLTAKGLTAKAIQDVEAVERGENRSQLRAKGLMLLQMQPSMSKTTAGPSKSVEASLNKLASQLNLEHLDSMSFKVDSPPASIGMAKNILAKGITKVAQAKQPQTTAFHIFMGVSKADTPATKGVAKKVKPQALTAKTVDAGKDEQKKSPIRKFVVLEAKEIDGKIVSVTEAHSK